MKFLQSILILLIFPIHIFAEPIEIGENIKIHSSILKEERQILVYKPSSYGPEKNNYPVIYLLDGRSHFHHVTGIINLLSRAELIPEMIVVGIANTDRFRDFTPKLDIHHMIQQPEHGADKFSKFISDELMPYINENYQTIPDHSTLIGHSYGGLFAIYTLFEKPNLFRNYIAISPYLAWNDSFYVKNAKQLIAGLPKSSKNLYLSMGNERLELKKSISEFVEVLKQQAQENLSWNFDTLNEPHTNTPHQSIYNALPSFYKNWKTPFEFIENGNIDGIVDHYNNTYKKFGLKPTISKMWLNGMVSRYLKEKNYPKVIKVYLAIIEISSLSAYEYNELATAYIENDQPKLAVDAATKAVQVAKDKSNKYLSNYEEILVKMKDHYKE